MKRGERRQKTRAIIDRRLKEDFHGLGLPDKMEEEPHRLAKTKKKFTNQNGSLKEDKKFANRKSRAKAKNAIRTNKEIPPEPKNSVKWSYW